MSGDWRDQAACRGRTDLFFGPVHESAPAKHRREAAAKKVCAGCPSRAACRLWALSEPVDARYGVAGGLTEGERGVKIPKRREAKHGTSGGLRSHRTRGEALCDECEAWERQLQEEACGTVAGRTIHVRRGEPNCPACRAAAAAYKRSRREANQSPPLLYEETA